MVDHRLDVLAAERPGTVPLAEMQEVTITLEVPLEMVPDALAAGFGYVVQEVERSHSTPSP